MNPTTEVASLQDAPLEGKRVLLLGTLGGFTKRESHQLIKQAGGRVQDGISAQLQMIVVGADSGSLDLLRLEDAALHASIESGAVALLYETQL